MSLSSRLSVVSGQLSVAGCFVALTLSRRFEHKAAGYHKRM
jgi:hypothetical protein